MIEYQPTSAVVRPAVARSAGLSSKMIISVIFFCLVVGHLAIKTYFPSIVINAGGAVLVASAYYWVLFVKKDPFALLVILFISSQFLYANNQGGLFNLAAFLVLLPYILTRNLNETRQPRDALLITLVLTLFIANLVGLIVRNPVGLVLRIQYAAAFSAFIMAFLLASSIRLDAQRIRKLVTVLGFFVLYNFAVSLNQHYSIIKIETPLLGLDDTLFYTATNAFGTFRSASANGQYAMIIFAFLVPLLSSTASRMQLGIKPIYIFGICFLCMATTVLANMRAAAAFIVLLTIFYTVMFGLFYRKSFRYTKYLNRFTVAAVLFLVVFGTVIGVQNIAEDFREAAVARVEDGDVLNRGIAWDYGMSLLTSRSWVIGYGHGGPESNLLATGAVRTATGLKGGGHLHNLYLMLPIVYGWIGAFAFVTLYATVLLRSVMIVKNFSFDNFYVVLNLAFMVSTGVWMLDEIKSGNIVQSVNFPMISFIWLGWVVAAQRTLRYSNQQARMQSISDAQ